MTWHRRPKRTRATTNLDASERRALARIRKFVRSYCGECSVAEALRFLIRDWKAP